MLDTFASVGADAFDLTVTTRQGAKVRFQRSAPLEQLRRIMPAQLDAAVRQEHNVIVRPRGRGVVFIQLDDLGADAMQRVQSVSFLGLETSPGNFQAWLAVLPAEADERLARHLRQVAGADPTASGATRIAGSLNFKEKYAPNFPRVQMTRSAPSLIALKERLERLGLPAEEPRAHPVAEKPQNAVQKNEIFNNLQTHFVTRFATYWPSYQRCILGAPPNHANTGPDTSRADFTWCLIAIDWGRGVHETAARLLRESTKARQNGPRYALRTAQRAAAARRG